MKKILIIFTLTLFIFGCSDSNPFFDKDKQILNTYGEIVRDTLYAVSDTYVNNGFISTASGPALSLGAANGFESRVLIKFSNLPADTLQLNSVKILIKSRTKYGEAISPIEGTLYRVLEDWEEDVNIQDEWHNGGYLSKLDQAEITPINFTVNIEDTVNLEIELPDTLVSIWHDTTNGGQNFGVMLDFNTADHVAEFLSTETGSSPQLIYSYVDSSDSLIQDTLFASKDAALVDFPMESELQNDSTVFVLSGYSANAIFTFDFNGIPANALLTSANFIFSEDTLLSAKNSSRSQNFYIRNITSDLSQLPDFEIDSTFVQNVFYNIILDETSENSLALGQLRQGETGQYFIQSVLNKTIDNTGFLVQYIGEGTNLSKYAIKRINQQSEETSPKLIIEYFLIPKTRI